MECRCGLVNYRYCEGLYTAYEYLGKMYIENEFERDPDLQFWKDEVVTYLDILNWKEKISVKIPI